MKILFLAMFVFLAPEAQSEELDDATKQALAETQAMLTDATARAKAMANDPQAQALTKQLNTVTKGDQAKQAEMYQLSSEIFSKMVQESNGDMEKLTKLLQEAQKNPEAFGKTLTEEQRQRVRKLAGEH